MNLKEQLQRAIEVSGMSINALSKAADVPYMAAHGFVKHDRAITIDTAGKLAAVLGLALAPAPRATAPAPVEILPEWSRGLATKPKRKRTATTPTRKASSTKKGGR